MTHARAWRGVGAGAAIGGVGLLLYLLIKNLGLGQGGTKKLKAPEIDARPLRWVLSNAQQLTLLLDGKPYTLDEMIARIRAGGRSDAIVVFPGDTRHVDEVMARLAHEGIALITSSERVSGNARGSYL